MESAPNRLHYEASRFLFKYEITNASVKLPKEMSVARESFSMEETFEKNEILNFVFYSNILI